MELLGPPEDIDMKASRAINSVLLAVWLSSVNAQVVTQTPNNDGSSSGISMLIEPAKGKFVVGEIVAVKVSLLNRSNKNLKLLFSPEFSSFVVHMHDEDGKTPPETPVGCRMHLSKTCAVIAPASPTGHALFMGVPPGKDGHFELNLSREYVLDHPGVLTLEIEEDDFRLEVPDSGPDELVGKVRSNQVSFRISAE